jgi:hypothetical protein
LSEEEAGLVEQAERNILKSGSDEPDVFVQGEEIVCKYCEVGGVAVSGNMMGTGQTPDGRGVSIFACPRCLFNMHVISRP